MGRRGSPARRRSTAPTSEPDFTGRSNTALTQRARVRLRGPGSDGPESDRQPIRSAGRFAHEAVSFDPVRQHPLPHRGRLRLRLRLLPLLAAEQRDGGRPARGRRHPADAQGGRRPNAHLEARQRAGTTYDVDWVDIAEPDASYPYTPGQEAPTPNNTALVHVASQGRAQGAALLLPARGADLRRRHRLLHVHAWAAARRRQATSDPAGYGNGYGQVWAFDTQLQTLTCIFNSPGADDARPAGQRDGLAEGHGRGVRGRRAATATTTSVAWRPTAGSGTSPSTDCGAAPPAPTGPTTSSPAPPSPRTGTRSS